MNIDKTLITSSSAFIRGIQPEAVWNIWCDIPNWPSWDHNFREVKLNSSFAIGGLITIFHKHYPSPTELRICNIEESRRFDTESQLAFGHVTVQREVVREKDGVKITHEFYLLPTNESMREMLSNV